MAQIFSTFGIDWRLLLINCVNFALVLGVLWYFLYTPVMQMLEKRRQVVIQGVRDAEAAAHERKEVENSRAQKLAQAGKEADEVISQARRSAIDTGRTMLARAEETVAGVLGDAEVQAKEIKSKAIEESKEEVAKMIVLGMEKMMAKK